jgi:hypothetical protein
MIGNLKNVFKLMAIMLLFVFTNNAYADLFSISNISGTVAVDGWGAVPASTGTYGTLNLISNSYVTYTYLGSQADWTNQFTSGGSRFVNYANYGGTP